MNRINVCQIIVIQYVHISFFYVKPTSIKVEEIHSAFFFTTKN